MKSVSELFRSVLSLVLLWSTMLLGSGTSTGPREQAETILSEAGVKGGVVIHLGCGDGRLTAALHANDAFLVQGLDTDRANVQRARDHIRARGLYGPVSVDQLTGDRLPYINNLANLIVVEERVRIPQREILRVLCPGGVACIRKGAGWTKTTKSRPEAIDEWTHYLHDASNNAVSHDDVVGPPKRLQWLGSPRWTRHHDRMSSVSAVVSTGGRVFYILDEASRASILLPPKWTLIARDAFNGVVLWKRRIGTWHTHLWPLKSGPAQLPRRLVAAGDRVYVTLGYDAPLTALDAATGGVVRTYAATKATEEVIFSEGLLLALVSKAPPEPKFVDMAAVKHAYGGPFWAETPQYDIMAVRPENGEILWTSTRPVLPVTLSASADGVFFHDGRSVVCLDRQTGDEKWRSEPVARTPALNSFFAPTLLIYQGIVLFAGGETAGGQTGSWYMKGEDTMTALSARTGEVLWKAYHPPSGYRSPEDLLVANGLVWTGETTSGRAVGVFTGRDPFTGEVKQEFPPNVGTYWFHHRCYRGKATDNYLLMARTGTEFIDVEKETWTPNHWVRGACSYGVMPANGLLYAPPHPCACYLEAKLFGFNALAPGSDVPRVPKVRDDASCLVKGPAYGSEITGRAGDVDWPTYRGSVERTGRTAEPVPLGLESAWETRLGENLSSPVVAQGNVFVAAPESHAVYALDAQSGAQRWRFVAGGRVDSPPTICDGRVLFGSADGWLYCLRAADGALIWRFRAAPVDERTVAFEQIESVWPVHGSVLVRDGIVYAVAGRSMFLDGGLRLLRLDVETGRKLSETVMDDTDLQTGQNLHAYVSWLNMPTAMPDILSCVGDLVYMRSQPFHLDGTRLPLEAFPAGADADQGAPPPIQKAEYAHLFCPTGFLDDSWWHRTYWMYGSRFISGWCGYYLAGKAAPAGRILVSDEKTVYGFGRKPQYYRWTTPIEHHLFAADKASLRTEAFVESEADGSRVRVAASPSLDPKDKPLTVEAWVKADNAGGVILARGGSSHGYVLYLQNGRPRFGVRVNQEFESVAAAERIVGRWVHLAGILTADRDLLIYVDGKCAGKSRAPGLLGANPAEAMEIAADESSTVGDYPGPFALKGTIDEVRLYHRALGDSDIARHASRPEPEDIEKADLTLWYSFDDGRAGDISGRQNHGIVVGAKVVRRETGSALEFSGKTGATADFTVEHHWTKEVPLLVRAMVLADETLFVAGPPDLIDEERTFRQMEEPQVRPRLEAQAAALAGAKGALLMAVSKRDGEELARWELPHPPVFDGMAAAGRRLYLTAMDGSVRCFGPQKNPAATLPQ
ncbi:MAG: PQQ-binding-like beta-propeller repeat protein [Phycisphaerales bacterium]|nr:MAG: PQQ-binding-like beta-propeller repeat protein [Phycisphaerales bacterium]